jgi:biotin operon repressor
MINLIKKKFFKKQINELTTEINHTFSKVAEDVDLLKRWVMHVNSKTELSKSHHEKHIEVSKQEIKNAALWIEHLKKDIEQMKKISKETTNYIFEMHNNQQNVLEKIQELEKRMNEKDKDMSEKDNTGQVRITQDKLIEPKGHVPLKRIPEEELVQKPEIKVLEKEELTTSQIELLETLYSAKEPLDYKSLAEYLNKKEKSIRNLIYELREKGVKIKASNIGLRRKGFYLKEEEKLKISGR